MELQIQYTRTDAGASIAYATVGQGPPVLHCPANQISMHHILDAGRPFALHVALASRTRLTVFDQAGFGASQRQVSDFSVGAQLSAIEAVADRMTDQRFTLCALGAGGVVAALYAAKHEDRVRELVLMFPAPSILTYRFAALMREDWSLARRRLSAWAYPDSIDTQRWFGNALRESATAEVAAAYCDEFVRTDLEEIYSRIPVRTLFCLTPGGQDREGALALASLVPDCRVVSPSDMGEGVAAVVLEFMGVSGPELSPSSDVRGDVHGTAVILFADIVDSTVLTERLGDAAFRAASRALDERIRQAIREVGGAPVDGKVLGDGVMGVFSSAAQTIEAARRCVEASSEVELPLHIGLHAGDVIREEGNVYGGAVNIASRICGLCEPGEILVSRTVADLARTSAGVTFEDRGEHVLKGIAEPQRVFAVRVGSV